MYRCISMEQETPKYIAGLTETRGEHVTRALRNVFDKMCQLEKDKKEAKRESELTHSKKDATRQSLREVQATHAAAEARCNLLELQLHHIRTLLGSSLDGVIWDDIQTETKTISTSADTYQSKSRIRKTVSKMSHDESRHLKNKDIPSREININQQVLPNSTTVSNGELFSSIEKGRTGSSPADSFIAPTIEDIPLSSSIQYHPSAPLPDEDDIGTITTSHDIIDIGINKSPARNKSSSRQSSKSRSRSLSKKPAPFILGKSTGDSHSVPANMQNVRNILKNGSGKLRTTSYQYSDGSRQERSAKINSTNLRYGADLTSTREDIKEVILQLEEEKAILLQEVFRCENLMSGAAHPSLVESLTPEVNSLKQRLKAKSLQIGRLNTLLEMIACPSSQQRYHLQTATLAKDKPGHLFVTTEITTRPCGKSIEVQTIMTKVSKTPERSKNSEINSNRQFLHELRDIKHSLQENNR